MTLMGNSILPPSDTMQSATVLSRERVQRLLLLQRRLHSMQQSGASDLDIRVARQRGELSLQAAARWEGRSAVDLDQQARVFARCVQGRPDSAMWLAQIAGLFDEPHPLPLNADFVKAEGRRREWWARILRRQSRRCVDTGSREAGGIGRQADEYTSDYSHVRQLEHERLSRQWLESTELEDQDGRRVPLADVADSTVSNPRIRFAELMARIKGHEKAARGQSQACLFFTLTCPSRFHSGRVVDGQGVPNPRYDGSTVSDGQNWLLRVWARSRAKLKRLGLRVHGIRIAEPHHDGTAHWHVLMFMDREHVDTVQGVLRHYACADEAAECGPDGSRRVQVKEIDLRAGSAVGYVVKYIAKGLAVREWGAGSGSCTDSGKWARVVAWARTWSIRQFQFFGSPSVGVWRELRRLREHQVGRSVAMREAWAGADSGDWYRYMAVQGGAGAPRSAACVGLVLSQRVDVDTGELVGDVRPVGLVDLKTGLIRRTRFSSWRLVAGEKRSCESSAQSMDTSSRTVIFQESKMERLRVSGSDRSGSPGQPGGTTHRVGTGAAPDRGSGGTPSGPGRVGVPLGLDGAWFGVAPGSASGSP